jgi:hypothetical protein
MRHAVVLTAAFALLLSSQIASATKCFEIAQGFSIQARILPGPSEAETVLHISCGGHAALIITSPGHERVRKEWHLSFEQMRALLDSVESASFYSLPRQLGDGPPTPTTRAYKLRLYRDLNRYSVVYYGGLPDADSRKVRFAKVWITAFESSGAIPPLP